jgi:hypothetical protein
MTNETVTYTEVLQAYADAMGILVDTLTDAQRKQAFLNAVLDGLRVEPFATWCDRGDAAISELSPGAKTLNQLLRECETGE